MLLFPFEPRRPVLELAGLEVTLLEIVAAVALAGLAWAGRHQLVRLLEGRPWPLLLLGAYAGAHQREERWR
jgi:hypothetical protein